jgi:hypothetical protein
LPATPGSIPAFRIHDVEVGPKLAVISPDEVRGAWGQIGKLLAHSKVDVDLPVVEFFTSPNLLAACVYKAFYNHYPIKINPNTIWLTICQGFAVYVDGNSEELRSKFVSFEGKQTLTVIRPDFTRDYQNNKWEEVFPSFVSQITGYVGKPTAELLDCNFSNSTPLDKAAAYIAVMDIMKHYSRYEMVCGCGIPYKGFFFLFVSLSHFVPFLHNTFLFFINTFLFFIIYFPFLHQYCPFSSLHMQSVRASGEGRRLAADPTEGRGPGGIHDAEGPNAHRMTEGAAAGPGPVCGRRAGLF